MIGDVSEQLASSIFTGMSIISMYRSAIIYKTNKSQLQRKLSELWLSVDSRGKERRCLRRYLIQCLCLEYM